VVVNKLYDEFLNNDFFILVVGVCVIDEGHSARHCLGLYIDVYRTLSYNYVILSQVELGYST